MSKLRDEFNKILLDSFSAVAKHDDVSEDYYAGKLIRKVKAQIEECEMPENPFTDAHASYCCGTGMIEMKKALMESLE